MHGGGIPDLIDANPQKYMKALKRASLIVCPSTFIKDRLNAHNISTVVIENSLPLSQYPFKEKNSFSLNIFWMRTLEPLYNPEMALEVGRILKEKNIKFNLQVAGQDKGQLQALQQLRNQYNLQQEVQFCGLLNHKEKLAKANECDLFICTNHVDNAPVSLIEMMALGLPIVSSNVGGINHFITNNVNGFLVEDNDAETMADRLLEIHLSPSVGRRFAMEGYDFSRKFDDKAVIKKWNHYFNFLREITPKTKISVRQLKRSEVVS
jgi:glycosyltransferase involved in cell wall biosynthesis